MAKSTYNNIYQFKITLLDIKPPIWRRIQVPENYSFWDFHVAIQNAMGWTDSHLHGFYLMRPDQHKWIMLGIPDDEFPGDTLPGWKHKIKDWFPEVIKNARYEYDFGDGWVHKIEFEKMLPGEDRTAYPQVTGGKRACPPEDCGGSYGYESLLNILADPSHEDHEDMLEWLFLENADQFDPEEFACEDVEFEDPKERFDYVFSEA